MNNKQLKAWNKVRNLIHKKKLKKFDIGQCKQLETELLIKELYIVKVCNNPYIKSKKDLYIARFRNKDLILLDAECNYIELGINFKSNLFLTSKIVDKIKMSVHDIAVRHNTFTFNGERI